MNDFVLKEASAIDESYLRFKHRSGLTVILVPKTFPTSFAMLGVKFGASDNEYSVCGEKVCLPLGSAHFLEHKMFENPDGSDAFSLFDKYGASANAYTSYDSTCYYFSCTENFEKNLDLLLYTVTHPHFDEESVCRERDIIGSEIAMYEDSPQVRVHSNLMKALYAHNPLRLPISGSIESISRITPETLYRCYNDFYIPSNMVLVVCGDVQSNALAEKADRYFLPAEPAKSRPQTLIAAENGDLVKKSVSGHFPISSPMYSIGFKCPLIGSGAEAMRKATAVRLAISLVFGRSSDFYCKNYESGLINDRFSFSYEWTSDACHLLISGSGSNPEQVLLAVIAELEYRKNSFFTEEQFLRDKRASYASSITLFDSGEEIVSAFAGNEFAGFDEYDYLNALTSITSAEAHAALRENIDTGKHALSVLYANQQSERKQV